MEVHRIRQSSFCAIRSYDQEPLFSLANLNEYNDDINDEWEKDYEPLGVQGGDVLTDYDEIKAYNKAVRAQEAEDAFWESICNRNHSHAASIEAEAEEEKENVPTHGNDVPLHVDTAETEKQTVQTQRTTRTMSTKEKSAVHERGHAGHRGQKEKVKGKSRKQAAMRKQAKGMM